VVSPLVMATDAMLADVVSEIVGDAAEVVPLVEQGGDPADAEPSARSLLRLDEADLVVTIGLGYESEALGNAVERAAGRGTEVLELGEELDPRPYPAAVMADREEVEAVEDPHVWVDPQRMASAVDLITRRLSELRAEFNTPEVLEASEHLVERLHSLDGAFREVVDDVDEDERRLFSTQPVYGYLTDRYEMDYVGSVVPVALGGDDTAVLGEPLDRVELERRLDGMDTVITEPEIDDDDVLAVLAETGVDTEEAHAAALGSQIEGSGSYIDALGSTLVAVARAIGGELHLDPE
jgi:ABC-type Zn uptake system ZnuABC Zn-binding protein ZnuA